ncbi:MAG: CHAT domain-containing protein/tetratricopeptide (TPR) repeat protein [Pseudohongiellaceae bacterium]|jgi:CHAT domain-containing protein/tetratricopeptide (TPR) repeat protein
MNGLTSLASGPWAHWLLCLFMTLSLLGQVDETSPAQNLKNTRLEAIDVAASGQREAAATMLREALGAVLESPVSFQGEQGLSVVANCIAQARNWSDELTYLLAHRAQVALLSLDFAAGDLELLVARFDLAKAFGNCGQYREGLGEMDDVLAGMTAALPVGHPSLVVVRRELVVLLRGLGDFERALTVSGDLLADLRVSLGDDAPETLVIAMEHSENLESAGQWVAARDLADRTLPVLKRVFGTTPDIYPLSLLRTGRPRYLLGDLEGAEALQREALQLLSERGAGKQSGDYQVARLHLAQTLKGQGDLLGARALAEAAMAVYGDTLPYEHPNPALARGILASVLMLLGDDEAGLLLQREVVARLSLSQGQSHPLLIEARSMLAKLTWMSGDLLEADELFAAILKGLDGSQTNDLIRLELLLERGEVLLLLGQVAAAVTLQQEALAGARLRTEDAGPIVALAQRALAASQVRLGELDLGAELVEAAFAGLSDHFPNDHQEVLWALAEWMEVEHLRGRRKHCAELAGELSSRMRRFVAVMAATTSPRELESVSDGLELPLSALVRVAIAESSLAPLALQSCEVVRGVGLASAELSRQVTDDGDFLALRDQIRGATADLVVASTGSSRLAVATAREARDALQRALSEHLAALGHQVLLPDLKSLAGGLPPGSALYTTWQFSTVRGGPVHLAGAVLRGDGEVQLVDLGGIDDIAKEVSCWRAAVGVPYDTRFSCEVTSVRACGEILAARLLTPFAESLKGVSQLALSLDGPLHLLPMDVLPWEAGLLGEAMVVRLRPGVGRALADASVHTASSGAAAVSLLAVGGLDYGAIAQGANGLGASDAVAPRGASQFSPLPASSAEARQVTELFEQTFEGSAEVLSGLDVQRSELAAAVVGKTTIHLATHAWSRSALPPDSWSPESRSPESRSPESRDGRAVAGPQRTVGLSPLLLTGVALSGANVGAEGLLTAEEFAAFDLRAAELVVLSGCATQTGAPRAWQGLSSLRKAAHLAGARNVVASLWPVDDHWTAVLMDAFYRGLWEQGLPAEEALWQARSAVRTQAQLPRHWAGWVLARSGP